MWANGPVPKRPRRALKRRTPIGARARRRILAGGPRATGRRAASREEWAAIRELVLARARWACQACGLRRRLDVHHVVKRSQGGSDFDLNQLVALCRSCHEQTDAPYARGRLVVTPMGLGEFTFEMVQRAGKWATDGEEGRLPMWANASARVLPTWATRGAGEAGVPIGVQVAREVAR